MAFCSCNDVKFERDERWKNNRLATLLNYLDCHPLPAQEPTKSDKRIPGKRKENDYDDHDTC